MERNRDRRDVPSRSRRDVPVLMEVHNKLLSALPASDRERLQLSLQRHRAKVHDALFEEGGRSDYVYFPERGTAVSRVQVFANGALVDVGITGDEGIIGLE